MTPSRPDAGAAATKRTLPADDPPGGDPSETTTGDGAMDGETAQAVRMMQAEQRRRVRRDLRRDELRARDAAPGGKVGRTGRHALSVGQAAYFNALRTEGPEVATAAGDGYWRDMVRRHPHLRGGGVYDSTALSANGEVSRLGRVTQRYRDGKWWRRDERGRWVEAPAPRRDWSAA